MVFWNKKLSLQIIYDSLIPCDGFQMILTDTNAQADSLIYSNTNINTIESNVMEKITHNKEKKNVASGERSSEKENKPSASSQFYYYYLNEFIFGALIWFPIFLSDSPV